MYEAAVQCLKLAVDQIKLEISPFREKLIQTEQLFKILHQVRVWLHFSATYLCRQSKKSIRKGGSETYDLAKE